MDLGSGLHWTRRKDCTSLENLAIQGAGKCAFKRWFYIELAHQAFLLLVLNSAKPKNKSTWLLLLRVSGLLL